MRTTLRAGPFRFTVSGAGIGVSVGVPGFRVGSGPRGNYVRVGGQGIYYRTTSPRPVRVADPPPFTPPTPRPSDVIMQDVTGATVRQLTAASPSDLVTQLQTASRRVWIWPYALAATVFVSIVLGAWGVITLAVGAVAVSWLILNDRARRSVVVMYDVTDEPARAFTAILDATQRLQQAQRMWLITQAGAVTSTYQYKVNSGATTVLQRQTGSVSMGGPPGLVTNIPVPTLACGTHSMHFLPDRILLHDGKTFADMSYQALQISATTTRFIEDSGVPRDSRQVDTTWKYVNVRGGPDRRFNNNRVLPIMLYGRLVFTSPHGLNRVWDVSRPAETLLFAEALQLAAAAPRITVRP
jgi:hypothetical protein